MAKINNNLSPKNQTKNLKKKYIKPSVKSEKIFETAALACGKCIAGNPISGRACRAVPRLS